MIQAAELISLFQRTREERWGYIWGKSGQTWTQKDQNRATREQTVKWGGKWVGRPVADCSGLFVWAFKELGSTIYHGSNTIWKKHLKDKGDIITGLELPPGAAVFLLNEQGVRHHIGLHIGGGDVIEAKGTYYGVVKSKVSDWDEWGLLAGVDYTDAWPPYQVTVSPKTIRKGNRGGEVKRAQNLLIGLGYSVGEKGADGIFGEATKAAVRAFQGDRGLKADGIIGAMTWAALGGGNADGNALTLFSVLISGLREIEATGLIEAWGDRASIEKGVM